MPYKDFIKEKERQERRRKTLEYKLYQNNYQKKWRKRNPQKIKAIREKSEARPQRKEYIKKWNKTSPKAGLIRKRFNMSEKRKQYDLKWNKENPEKVRAKYARYYNSLKGIVNRLKKSDKRKFKIVNNDITIDLIKMVNERDKLCPYCHIDLSKIKKDYDHLDPFKPFSKLNILRCCFKCNEQKINADVLRWCEFKKYKPAEIVYKLLNEQGVKK